MDSWSIFWICTFSYWAIDSIASAYASKYKCKCSSCDKEDGDD